MRIRIAAIVLTVVSALFIFFAGNFTSFIPAPFTPGPMVPQALAQQAPGTWSNVTPGPISQFCCQSVVADPLTPSTLYWADNHLYRSTDYGITWAQFDNGSFVSDSQGLAIAPTSPRTLYSSYIRTPGVGTRRSTDGGVTWTQLAVPNGPSGSPDVYPPSVDPYDPTHLIMPVHENNGIWQSFNSGTSWSAANFPVSTPGGTAFVFFINTGSASTTKDTWLWIAQDSGGTYGTQRTTNSGVTWTKVNNNEHPHGNAQIYQPDTSGTVFMAGNYGTCFGGVYRSNNYGANGSWTCVANVGGFPAAVIGTPNNVYEGSGWASGGGVDPNIWSAPVPGITGWVHMTNPGMTNGIGQFASTFDGTNYIILAAAWEGGLWRYVEPVSGGPTATPTATPTGTGLRSYYTTFPATENPISESSNWTNGGTTGVNWTNVRTTTNKVFGTEVGNGTGNNRYDDSTAVLTGSWAASQGVQATIYVTSVPNPAAEVELRLRTTITANSITGYEFECSIANSQYADIVRWNGALGSFTPLAHSTTGCASGDVLGATAVGSTLTLYKNGVSFLTATDSTYTNGKPGIGFFLADQTGINANYGFTNFAANDSGTLPSVSPTATPTSTIGPTFTPTPTPTITPTPTTTPTPPTGATPTNTPFPVGTSVPVTSLHVAGNQILNGANQSVRLRGVDFAGGEYMCPSGGVWDYQQPVGGDTINQPGAGFIAALKTWQVNAVRLTLNEDCWLGINGLPSGGLTAASYRTAVVNLVNTLNANNFAVVLSLQWTRPGVGLPSFNFDPMPDADHAPAFWTSVANNFLTNHMVIFDLYNEPYPDTWEGGYTTQAWLCLRDGRAACPGSVTNAGSNLGAVAYTAVGMQELVTAIRATGSTSIIQSPGLGFSNVVTQWLAYQPIDTLNPPQIVADWHSYQGQVCSALACWNSDVKPIALQVPVVTNEIGENDCSHIYIDSLMPWMDDQGVNYLAWQWNTYSCANSPALITDYAGNPTNFGVGYQAHLLALAGVPTPTPVPVVFECAVFPCGINVGSNSNFTASDGTIYYADVNGPGLQLLNQESNNGDFQSYTVAQNFAGTPAQDQALYQHGKVGRYGAWAVNVPTNHYDITFSVAPTSLYTGIEPVLTGPVNAGQYGQDQFVQNTQPNEFIPAVNPNGNSPVSAFCIWSSTGASTPCGGSIAPNTWPTPVANQVNTITWHNLFVSSTQVLQLQVNASNGGGRHTIAGPIKIALTNPGTPTPTPVPGSTNTPTPTNTAVPTSTATSTSTPTPNPTAGIPASESFSTGSLGSFWSGGVTQIGSGAFSQDTSAPRPGETYDMRFSRSSASASRAGVLATHSFNPPQSRIVYAQAYLSIDFIPTGVPAHSAHIFSVSQPQGLGETAYFDVRDSTIESSIHLRDGTWRTVVVDATPPGPWFGLRLKIDMSGTNPVITWYEDQGSGFAVVDQITDTSIGAFSIPASLRIGAWVDPADTAWAGSLIARFADVAISDTPLP